MKADQKPEQENRDVTTIEVDTIQASVRRAFLNSVLKLFSFFLLLLFF